MIASRHMFSMSKLMLFPLAFSKELVKNSIRFSIKNIDAIPKKIGGVYIILYKQNFIYVGQSKLNEGLSKRLYNHYNGSHSEDLSVWIEAFYSNIHFTYISCCDTVVDDLERSLIRHLQPITNKIKYRSYQPHSTQWTKTYG